MRLLATLTYLIIGLVALNGCALLAGGATASSAAYMYINHHRGSPTFKTDKQIEDNLTDTYSKKLDSSNHVRIIVFQQNVLLLGQVQSKAIKQQLQAIAQSNDKIKAIYNRLIVAPPSAYTSRWYDSWVTTKINTALLNNEALQNTPFATVSDNGTIYVLGDELTSGQVRVIKDRISTISGVNKIIYLTDSTPNELVMTS